MSIKKAYNFFLPVAFFLFCFVLKSQTSAESSNPFSRYGIGELENKGFAPMAGMARATTAFENDTLAPVFINSSNPASLASLQLACFELGGKSYFNFFQSANSKVFKNNSYLSYLALGFPVGKKAGVALSLSPYSNVGYRISDVNAVDSIGSVQTIYEGNGGINQIMLSAGYKPFKNLYTHFRKSKLYDTLAKAGKWKIIQRKRFLKTMLSSMSLGANGIWMFGTLNSTSSVVYPTNSYAYFNTRRLRNTRVNDFYANYGALITFKIDSTLFKRKCIISDTSQNGYHIEYRNNCPCRDTMNRENYLAQFPKKFQSRLNKDLKITLGATASLPMELRANYSALAYTYKDYTHNTTYTYDTTLNVAQSGKILMPLMMSFGLGVKKGNSLTLLADVNIQNWSFYRYFGIDQQLKNSVRYALGFQYINNGEMKTDADIYKKKMFWRGGIYYNSGYLQLKNNLISEYGVTIGSGIPLGKRVISSLNVSAEFGTWGTTNSNLIKNNFIRCTLGFTLNDRWFVKRVID